MLFGLVLKTLVYVLEVSGSNPICCELHEVKHP